MTFSDTLKILTIVFLATISYITTLNGAFVFDDVEAVVKNQDLNVNNSLINIFYNDFWGTNILSNYSHKSYRPLAVLFYRLNVYMIGTKSPFSFHAVNIILYALVCSTLYILLSTILTKNANKSSIAFVSAVLFAVHPVHTEVVSSVVGQADLLCSLTFFLAIISYHYASVNNSKFCYILTLMLITTSMFFKETGVTALGICSCYDLLQLKKKSKISINKKFIIRQIGLVLLLFVLLYIRWKVMNFTGPTFQSADNPASFSNSTFTRILSYNYIYFLNTLLLIWPQWLCFDWSMGCISLLENFLDIRFLIVMLYWLLVTVFVCTQLLRGSKVLLFALSLCVIPFLPASNLWLRVGFVIAERTLFVPSAGFCLLISCGFHRLSLISSTYKQILNILFILLCTIFLVRTWHRNNNWLNEQDLFSSGLDVCPSNAKVHYNIAKIAADNNDIHRAEIEYRKAIKLHPTYDQAMNNLGNLLRDMGKLDESKQVLTQAVTIRPEFAAAWMNLGIVLATLEQYKESEESYLMALKYRRNYSDCYYNLGNLYLKLNRNDEALQAWEQAVIVNPSHSAAWSNTLVLLDGMGQSSKVLEVGKAALTVCPTSAALHFTFANTLGKLEKWQQAEHHFRMAVSINPDSALYWSNFGVLYHRWGKLDKAIKFYEQALRLNPQLTTTLNNLNKIKTKL